MEITEILTVKDPRVWEYIQSCRTLPRPGGNPGGKKVYYKDSVMAFDIETSRLQDIKQSIMYIWQYQIDEYCTVVGRTWSEFLGLIQMLCSVCADREKWVVYVHNLSYEFQFLAGVYHFEPDDVFCVDSRKILRAIMADHIELRCSYLHSNMSLDEYTEKWGVEYAKQSGYDYDKVRYPWTPVEGQDLLYCVNDVRGLVQALKREMEMDGDNLYTIPLTSTGYVRRDIRQAMRTYNRDTLYRQLPNMEIYTMLYEAFRGGNTHANRYFSGQVIGESSDLPYIVHSYDRSSSYPDVQCNQRFPVGRWQVEPPDLCTIERLDTLMNKRRKAMLLRVAFVNIRLRDPEWPVPYLSVAKCREVLPDPQKRTYDNGRLLASRLVRTTVTDVDLRIIAQEYEWDDMVIESMAHSTYGKLPNQFTEQVKKYYRGKTGLKNVPGQELYYSKYKQLLNSIYGFSVQNPCKEMLLFEYHPDLIGADYVHDHSLSKEQLLMRNNSKAFTSYAWGIWTSAWARWQLERGIQIAHNPSKGCYVLYVDTDSVKWFCDNKREEAAALRRWKQFNARAQSASKSSGAYATDPKGITHYMGVYEGDGEYSGFITLGAKKYAYTVDGSLHLTVAGVNKRKGAAELQRAGGLQAFVEGFVFVEGGGTESVYNDYPEIDHIEVDGHRLPITRNVVIRNSTYTLGITGDYSYILSHPRAYEKIFDDMY